MIRLSKQEKRLKKFKHMQESRKEKRKRSHLLKRVKRNEMLGEMSIEERKQFINEERATEESIKNECERVYTHGIPLIFDLSYAPLMTPVEIGSLQSQISDSVGFLRKQVPQYFKLICANTNCEISEKLSKRGVKKWQIQVCSEEISEVPEVVGKEIIYLSPDADVPLTEISKNCVYVIGGLVDKTIQSKKSLERGVVLGVTMRKLPIRECLGDKVKVERRVFNINTVVQVLHWMASGDSCTDSLLKSIPKRWLIENKPIS